MFFIVMSRAPRGFSIRDARVRKRYVHDPVIDLVRRHHNVECYVMEDAVLTLTRRLRRLPETTKVTPFTNTAAAFARWPRNSGGMLAHSDIVYSRKYRRGGTVAFIHDGTGQAARSMRELKVGISAASAAGVAKILVFANISAGAEGRGRRDRNGNLTFCGTSLAFERLLQANTPRGYVTNTLLLQHYQQTPGCGRMMGPVWAVIEKI